MIMCLLAVVRTSREPVRTIISGGVSHEAVL